MFLVQVDLQSISCPFGGCAIRIQAHSDRHEGKVQAKTCVSGHIDSGGGIFCHDHHTRHKKRTTRKLMRAQRPASSFEDSPHAEHQAYLPVSILLDRHNVSCVDLQWRRQISSHVFSDIFTVIDPRTLPGSSHCRHALSCIDQCLSMSNSIVPLLDVPLHSVPQKGVVSDAARATKTYEKGIYLTLINIKYIKKVIIVCFFTSLILKSHRTYRDQF